MANSYKLTPKNITQKQIDALIRIVHASQLVITDCVIHSSNPRLMAVLAKDHKKLCKAEKAFSKLSD